EDAAAYNALLDACADDEKLGLAAAELWKRRMSTAGVAPDSATFGALLKAAARCEDCDAARRWFRAMEAAGIPGDVVKYSTVCDAHARAGDMLGAEAWLQSLRGARLRPNVVSFSSLLKACERAAEPHRAVLWLKRLCQVEEFRPNAPCYAAVARAYGAAGDPQAARRARAAS
ncbi:unnamed protein product, partial [Polarella glacialis]